MNTQNKIDSIVRRCLNERVWKSPMRNLMLLGLVLIISSEGLQATVTIKNETQDAKIRKIAYGHLSARAIHIACYYKLFDLLNEVPKHAEEMVSNTPYKAHAVKSLMRVLANHEIVTMDEEERFSLNANSRLLISTAPQTLQPAFAKEFDLKRWQSIGNIQLALTRDESPFEQLFDQSFYAYLEKDKEAAELFNKGMKNFSDIEDEQVSRVNIFKDFRTYCDIGGGTGGLLSKVIARHSGIQGILLDLPAAIEECTLAYVTKIGGSFFEAVPPAEVYTVKRVLHNWSEGECIKILCNIRDALSDKAKGRILVIEKVLPKKVDGSFLTDCEIISLALGGRERTLGEFIKIGGQAGLELEDQIALPSGVVVMVFRTIR